MLGPSGPRRLRLSVEHLAQYRGGICFCIDLDPRWVIKLIQKGWTEHLKAYQAHCIDQAVTILGAGHDIKCMFGTPKLIEALCLRLEEQGTTLRKQGVLGIFAGGTEFTPQWTRFAVEELLDGTYITPTYGNTLMGLAGSKPVTRDDGYKITYYAPQPRAVIEVVDPDRPDRRRRVRRDRARPAHHVDARVLRPGLPRARRGRARAAVRAVPVGRHQRRAAVRGVGDDDDGRRVLTLAYPGTTDKALPARISATSMGVRLASVPRESSAVFYGWLALATAALCTSPALRARPKW